MNRLIIIRGNSGSGKSTVAKRLRYELGYGTMLIPQDVVRREIIRVKDTPDNPSIQLIKSMALYGRDIGYDVIIEGILSRARYGEMLHDLGGVFEQTHAYYFDISFEETLRRHQSRPDAHEFGEELMREWYVAHDVLDLPGERVIVDELSEDEVLAVILGDLSVYQIKEKS